MGSICIKSEDSLSYNLLDDNHLNGSREIESLEKIIKNLKQLLNPLNETIKNLEHKNSEQTARILKLKTNDDILNIQNNLLKKSLDKTNNEIENLTNNIINNKNIINTRDDEIAKYILKNNYLEHSLKLLQFDENDNVITINQKMLKLNNKLNRLKKENNELKNHINSQN